MLASIWKYIRKRVTELLVRIDNWLTFRRHVLDAAKDGVLTAQEQARLSQLRLELGVGDTATRRIGASAYLAAYKAATEDGFLTREEEEELQRIQGFFDVEDEAIETTKASLARFRLLREIAEGDLPRVSVPGLGLQRGEVPHWVEPATLLEERVTKREYVGASSAVSVRLARGITYRVGARRGQLRVTTGIVPVSDGTLIITSKRLLFRGDSNGFSAKIDKVLTVEMLSDGVRILESSGKPRILKMHSTRDFDILGSILSYVFNNSGS